jgi:CRP-like cAMP-binding protein
LLGWQATALCEGKQHLAVQGTVMAKQSRGSAKKAPANPLRPNADGTSLQNKILLALPRHERERVLPKLELVRLQSRQMLHDVGDILQSAYFCNTGLISILSVFSDGKSVEVGLIGKEGFLGLPLVAGFRSASTRAMAQIEGTAFRIGADSLQTLLRECPGLERSLQQFSQIMAMQATQIAACNRLHEVEERLGRWLLMSADRVDTHTLALTQELLAQMLGTRRSSVTLAAGILQKAGLIAYTRGNVTIVDRPKLEDAACECYALMQRQIEQWRKDLL